jgi:hypothetical protein
VATALSARDLLDLWDQGRGSDRQAQARALWRAAAPDADDLEARPLGRRNADLLRLRMATAGPVAACYTRCPTCGEELEVDLDLAGLVQPEPEEEGPIVLDVAGWRVVARLPSAREVQRCAGLPEPGTAVLRACVAEVRQADEHRDLDDVPVEVLEALDVAMGRRDPNADLVLDLRCAACGGRWSSRLDVAAFLWREVEVVAEGLLREVHLLARAYGWTEEQVLALPQRRRRAYLDLVLDVA